MGATFGGYAFFGGVKYCCARFRWRVPVLNGVLVLSGIKKHIDFRFFLKLFFVVWGSVKSCDVVLDRLRGSCQNNKKHKARGTKRKHT